MSVVPITKRGAEMLKEELHRLKTRECPTVVSIIAKARAQGDLSESAGYDAVEERQGFIEGRIQEIESKLSAVQIIDPASLDADGHVAFGAVIDLEDLDSGKPVMCQIIGDNEANLETGKISVSSPIARTLIGKLEDDVAIVIVLDGGREYEVLAIEYL